MSVSEIIANGGRRRHWGAAEKLRIVTETLDGHDSISVVARRNDSRWPARSGRVRSETAATRRRTVALGLERLAGGHRHFARRRLPRRACCRSRQRAFQSLYPTFPHFLGKQFDQCLRLVRGAMSAAGHVRNSRVFVPDMLHSAMQPYELILLRCIRPFGLITITQASGGNSFDIPS